MALFMSLIGWSSCIEDDSSLGGDLDTITITGMDEEDAISVVSYTGVNLGDLVKPEITSTYPEEQLTYAWFLFDQNASEDTYQNYQISSERVLDYEVNLKSGTYALVFEVTSQTDGYVELARTSVQTSTPYSRGFYILKETTGGDTELDIYNGTDFLTDRIAFSTGSSLSGKPYNISVLYSGEYINPDENKTDVANMVHVSTEDGNRYIGFRTEDLTKAFEGASLFYSEEMGTDEYPAVFANSIFNNFYFSNTGVRVYQCGVSMGSSPTTGRMGYAVGNGASRFVQISSYTDGFIYWSNADHEIQNVDYNAIACNPVPYEGATAYPNDLECLASGYNTIISSAWFLCEQPSTGDRYLFLATYRSISKVIKLDPSLHLAQAEKIGGNGRTASYIYCIDDNKLYAYSLSTGGEQVVTLHGIPVSETLDFVTNQYLNFSSMLGTAYNFDNLIVGTRSGNSYKLYFYGEEQMNGGMPIAEAENVVEGEGRVHAVRYVAPMNNVSGMYLSFGNVPFPISD